MRTIYQLLLAVVLFSTVAASHAQTLTPTSVTLKPSQTQQFTVQSAPKNVYTWAIIPNSGTISEAGLYKAPATITAVSTVTIYATYIATHPDRLALTSTVTLKPLVGISVSPSWISMTNGQSAAFSATITGASNTAVTWSNPTVGSVTSGGIYTVPMSLNSSQNITLTATSVVDPTKSVTATIALIPTIGLTLNPTSTSLTGGQSTSLNATVTGTTNMGLNWSLSPQMGTLSNGVYTAPSPIPSAQTVTVTAASQASTGTTASLKLSLVPVSIALSPSSASLTSGQSTTLTATVSGTGNTGVNWAVSPAVGTVTNGVYTAPALVTTARSVTVTAASVADRSKSASAVISLTPSVSITMTPSSASLKGGQSATFKATVSGSTSNTRVNWSLSPSVGTIVSGVYTAPATVASAHTVTVTAASASDPTKNVSAKVSLVPVAVTVSPTTASLTGGQSTTLKAAVSGSSNTSVNWSLSPSVGTIAGGIYTAPSTIASAQAVTVKATSAADTTKSASATISLTPVGVTVSPSAASLSGGQSTTLKATVTGSSNTSVNWSLSPSVGTIAGGIYTAPSTIAAAQAVTVKATSAADATKTASAAISLVPPAPAVAISVTPSSASLTGGQSATFAATVTVSSNTAVNWTVAPPVGTITNGVYTAPALISLHQTVTVSAASAADPTKIASASVTLVPTLSVSVAPTSVTLTPSQSQQFSASLSGTTNPNVTWSMSPSVGSLGNGLYQAPATINSQQTVTVTATSSADSTKTSSATITLVPTVGIALTPSSISLTGGQSTQFNLTNAGAPASASSVTWTLAPQVGNITNGVYTAPVTINALQTIVLTVASIANPTQTATATITLTASTAPATSISPSLATLTPSQTQQFTATGLGTNPKWTISPTTGSIASGGLYSAPSSVTSQTTITVTATNATDSSQAATATVTLNPAASQTPPPTTITLPLEVVGPNGYTVSASFNIPSGTNLSGLTFWMQIHGLRSQAQASVQVNNSAWQPISEGNVTLLGLANNYGGIGGGFHTFQMTMPATGITTGTNTITFRFNGTDGAVSGFRVLQFNVQTPSGSSLIPSSTFVNDDPNNWQPPSTAASDIAAGQTLWRTASLAVPSTTGSSSPIKAHCMDCHAQDGRDLKYFNYSNNSIQARSVFHGLTAAQGNQIASYIRSLSVPNPGRPWNPPYQPGPGLDSQPTSDWSAGAGLDAVLDSDAEMLPYLTPGGSTAGWAANQYLNQREIPIALQLPDWNSWLPVIHPMDAFGSSFTNSTFYTLYGKARSELVPNDQTAYKNALFAFYDWSVAQGTFMVPINSTKNWTASLRTAVYSTSLWNMVKLWELNQEFGLEAMPQVVYGSKADIHSWYGSQPFYTSPTLQHIPAGPGLGNGSNVVNVYLSMIWYQMQLILNDGQGQETDHSPIDFGYTQGRLKDLALAANNPPEINLELEWIVKALQEETLSGRGPDKGNYGWHPVWTSPSTLVNGAWEDLWSATSPSQRATLTTDYVNAWFAQIQNYTAQQFYTGGWASPTDSLPALDIGTTFGGQMWFMLPRLRYYGVDATLTDQISAWAAKIWPHANWSLNNSATCSTGLTCTSGY